MTFARTLVERRVEFADTDASGYHHFTALLRWLEAAETVLVGQLGIGGPLAGSMPRVHLEVDYLRRVRFLDLVEIELEVAKIGRSSLTYVFLARCGGEEVARGSYVVVRTDEATGRSAPWPAKVREAFESGGELPGERLSPDTPGRTALSPKR